MGATGQYLAVLGKLHLRAAEYGAHCAEAHQPVDGIVDGDDRRGLAEAVAFIDVHASCAEQAHQPLGNAASSADDDHLAAAEFLAPVAVYHLVVEPLHDLVPQRYFLDDAIVEAHAVFEGAEIDGFLD